uniref:Uncharacterized protein n=1 Tax=Acrobeloides nanus TaxID=290746 RepID=A0A914DUU0_9BILA
MTKPRQIYDFFERESSDIDDVDDDIEQGTVEADSSMDKSVYFLAHLLAIFWGSTLFGQKASLFTEATPTSLSTKASDPGCPSGGWSTFNDKCYKQRNQVQLYQLLQLSHTNIVIMAGYLIKRLTNVIRELKGRKRLRMLQVIA